MKVIFFGLGSIGKRHLANLTHILEGREETLEVHAFRSNKKSTAVVEGVRNIYDEADLDTDYDLAFITNPTSLHHETMALMKGKTKWFFVEKPIFEKVYDLDGYHEPNRYYIAAPLRYKKTMQAARDLIAGEKVWHARLICSSYLPNWRNEDYRLSYSADETLGGGIELDCIQDRKSVV